MRRRGLRLAFALGLFASFAASAQPKLLLQPSQAKPGDPVLLTVQGAKLPPTGAVGDRQLRFYPWKDGFQALVSLPVEQALGPMPIKLSVLESEEKDRPTELTGTLEVVAPNYPTRELKVASQFIEPQPPALQARIKADQEAFSKAFAQPFEAPRFATDFEWPRPPEFTSPFGDLRTYNGKKQSQHYGTDFQGKIGDPINAANDGEVVLVRDAFASGNTVVIHHGANLYTAYFHMSKVLVKAGDQVKKGQLLGKVGKTGRVTGPHLHWGVKLNDLYVDGVTLVKQIHFDGPPAP